MRSVRTTRPHGQTWKTFLHTHAQQIWACDFLPVTDLFFRSQFAFFIVELYSRKVIHVGVTRSPTDAWTTQQRRFATAYGVGPNYLIRDNDSKFGVSFARVAKTSGIAILKTPYHAPRANAICERFLGSVRRECLDHLLILQEKQLQRVLNAYVAYFNQARSHQGIGQQIPEQKAGSSRATPSKGSRVVAVPILAGLHHDYRRSAYVLPHKIYLQETYAECLPMFINMQSLLIFRSPWNTQSKWMLDGTGVSGFKSKDILPLLTSCDYQGSKERELKREICRFLAGYQK